MTAKVKLTCLETDTSDGLTLSDNATQTIRDMLPGRKVFLGECNRMEDLSFAIQRWIGEVESVDGDTITIQMIGDAVHEFDQEFFDMGCKCEAALAYSSIDTIHSPESIIGILGIYIVAESSMG